MRRTSVLLDPHILAELERLARRSGRPTSHVIREAMERYVAEEAAEGETVLPSFVGIAAGPGNVAARDEEILREELPTDLRPPEGWS
jgi:predicted transcriptional regulator